MMHPIEDIRGSKSGRLSGTRIVLGITGSIAAVECVKLARELARHGAEVIPVMSEASTSILHPESIHFATGLPPITKLDGAVKHVELCGKSNSRADLLLIAPATANTISKIAMGIDDTVVTTMATCAIGSGMPIVIVPAMHSSMYNHKIVIDNIKTLRKLDVGFVGPNMDEDKAKMASLDEIINAVFHAVGPNDAEGKKILVITGSTREPVDDVRFLTNRSSGRTGVALALEGRRRGGVVEVWAPEHADVPLFLTRKNFVSVTDLASKVKSVKADIILVPAAISDFTIKPRKGKVSSKEPPDIKLTKAPKILGLLRTNKKAFIVGFKAETGIGKADLMKRAKKRMDETGIDLIVANLLEDVGRDKTKAVLILSDGKSVDFKGSKTELAESIFNIVLRG